MTVAYTGDKGEPELIPSGSPPTFAADVTEVAAWLQAGRSFRRVADMTALGSTTGMEALDLCLVDTIPGAWFQYDGTSATWVMHGLAVFADATARDAAIPSPVARMSARLADTGYLTVHTGTKWVRGEVLDLQLDTTNSRPLLVQQQGVGKITGGGGSNVTEAVTFPTAFGSTPVVVVSQAGVRATGAFNPAGLSAGGLVLASHYGVSITGFTVRLDTSGTLGSGNDFYYTWVAIGAL